MQYETVNPCSMAANPCLSGNIDICGDKFKNYHEAVDMGRKMWNDDTLGISGVACLSCHADFQLLNLEKRQNFPHDVKMTAMAAYYRTCRMQYLAKHRK
jgi:hypothetical protein